MNVGEVAALAGVTVRTLHHYVRGPACPPHLARSARAPAGGPVAPRRPRPGARRERASGGEDEVLLLRRQHRLLRDRLERTTAMVAAVEKEMEARSMGIALTPEERFEVFGEHDPARYEAEVQERWGDTDAYAQSKRRTAAYTKEDWLRIRAEGEDLMARMGAALRAGAAPDSAQAMDLAEEHRQQITATYYDCPPEMHAALGRMYVEDERFTATYEQAAPGLAQWVSAAVQANAARQG